MKKLYLAYGSNLNVKQMKHRCHDAKRICSFWLSDYQLIFRRGYLTVEPMDGTAVPCIVWEISEEDEKHLDRYEGVPTFYHKETLPIMLYGKEGEKVVSEKCGEALIYIMNDGFPAEKPSMQYWLTVVDGYKDSHFDIAYLDWAIENTTEAMKE